jgi:hypothetical protein
VQADGWLDTLKTNLDYTRHNMIKVTIGSIVTGVGLWTTYKGAVPFYGKINTHFTNSPRVNTSINYTPGVLATVTGASLVYSGWNANVKAKLQVKSE